MKRLAHLLLHTGALEMSPGPGLTSAPLSSVCCSHSQMVSVHSYRKVTGSPHFIFLRLQICGGREDLSTSADEQETRHLVLNALSYVSRPKTITLSKRIEPFDYLSSVLAHTGFKCGTNYTR